MPASTGVESLPLMRAVPRPQLSSDLSNEGVTMGCALQIPSVNKVLPGEGWRLLKNWKLFSK